jgi:sugar lactone lactonase YvrE
MNDRRTAELMREPAPGEREAAERSHELARAAFAERPVTSRPSVRLVPAVVAVVIALIAAVALTPAGGAIANLIREGLGDSVGERPAKPALTSLPSGGELLVVSERGPWVVHADGSQRLLGAYDDASWSPSGRFVVATDGRQLVALTPTGEPRWSLSRPAPVSGGRWSPFPGYRVAYLSEGSLRVVAGDGTGDALEARRVAAVAPAWRPVDAKSVSSDGEHVLAFADRSGRVEVRDTDSGRTLWRSAAGEKPVQLAWSPDANRLLAVGRRSVRIFDRDGRLLATVSLPAGLPAAAVSGARIADFASEGHEFALIRGSRTAGQSEVVLLNAEARPGRPRELFAGPGSFSELAWSEDGGSLVVGWPSADQFVFLRPERPRRVTAVSNVARQFDPGAGGSAAFPRISDWCCSP